VERIIGAGPEGEPRPVSAGEGERAHRVVEPEVVPLTATAEHFPEKNRRSLRRFGVDECLRVRRADAG
jgi:hypothetical protein